MSEVKGGGSWKYHDVHSAPIEVRIRSANWTADWIKPWRTPFQPAIRYRS